MWSLDVKRMCDIPELKALLQQNTTEASQDKHSSDCQVQVITGRVTERKFSEVSTAKAISLYIYTLTQFELKQWIVNSWSGVWVFSCGTIAECNWSHAGKILSTFGGRRIPAKMHSFCALKLLWKLLDWHASHSVNAFVHRPSSGRGRLSLTLQSLFSSAFGITG